MVDAPSRQEHRFDVMYRTWLSSEERAPLRRILETLRGARVWIVGGAVRDLLSRVPSDDVDLATDMTPEEVMDRFGDRAIPTGIRFGTVTVMASGQPFEVTTLRSERGYGDGRRPTEVEWGTQIEEDLARRDLTINAMAIDVSTGKLIDPYGGMEDLLHRRLRAVGDPGQRLSEDGLRILRAYRFMDAGPHRMVPDEGLRHALATHADMLDRISKERIWTEFRRILSGIDPSGTLHRMQVDGALGHVLPECILDVDALMHLGDGPSDALLRLTVLTWRTPVDHLRSVLKALTLSNAQLAVPLRLRKGIAMSLPSNQGERRRHRVLLGEDLDAVMRVRAATVDRFAEDDRRERREALLGTSEPLAGAGRLFDGRWVMDRTGLGSGIRLGRLMAWLHREQVDRDLSTLEEIEAVLCTLPWQHGDPEDWPRMDI